VVDVCNVAVFFVVTYLLPLQENGPKLDAKFVPLDAEVEQLERGE
jgi:hypothetical protein